MADIYNFTKSVKTWLAHLKSARRELKYLAFLNCAVNLHSKYSAVQRMSDYWRGTEG